MGMIRKLAVMLDSGGEETVRQFRAECLCNISVLDTTIPHPGLQTVTVTICGTSKAELQEVANWVKKITGVTVAYWKNDPVDSL